MMTDISLSKTNRWFLAGPLFFFLGLFSMHAQTTMTLQECIEYARANSLTLKQAEYGVENALLTDKLNRQARLPGVSGSAMGGLQFGRTIDPTTNSFNNERISFNSYGIDASVTLYNGGRINNTIKKGEYDIAAAKADVAFAFNNTALNIANAYLQILMAEEQLVNAEKRRSLSLAQLEQTDKMINAGTLPENDRLEVLAQLARDEQTIIQAQNLIDLNYLNLKEFMQLDPNQEIRVQPPPQVIVVETDPYAVTFREIYSTALGTQPQILRDEMDLKSAEMDVAIARAGMLPSLVLFGGLDTRWSSASKIVTDVETLRETQVFFIDDDEVEVGFDVENPIFADNPYFDQLDQNFGQTVGLNLNVPIYSNGRNSINVQRAELNILSTRLQSDLTKQQLKVDVQNAIASARAALRTLEASQKTLEAAQAAFQNAEKQYELGAINTFQFTTARNNLDIAETDLTVAKYDYLFRLKIIDFYLGRELKLN